VSQFDANQETAGSWHGAGDCTGSPGACAQVVHELLPPEQQEYALSRSASGELEGMGSPVADLMALGSGRLPHQNARCNPSQTTRLPGVRPEEAAR